MRKLRAEQETGVRNDTMRAPLKRDIPVDKDVGRTLGRKFSGSKSEHARTATTTVGEKQGVGITPGRGRQWPEIVHADRNSWSWCRSHQRVQMPISTPQ